MTRIRPAFSPNTVLHVFNRGNERRELFTAAGDYERFLCLLAQTQERIGLRLLAYALMPNHWHLVAWPSCADELSRFMQRLCSTHASEIRTRTETMGRGYVYQGRYRAVPVRSVAHYLRLIRYVEANPLRAGLVPRAEEWPWSSLHERLGAVRLIDAGPQPLPPLDFWIAHVNRPMTPEEIAATRWRR